MKTVLILGGSGMVGRELIKQALEAPEVGLVVAPSRRPLPVHDNLSNPIVDFEQLPAKAEWWRADAALCALGTTLRKAGSQEGFRRVDHNYVLAAARLARQAGTPVFVLNSSVGAAPSSKSFYLRVKGQVERDLEQLGFTSLSLVRPSLLAGGKRPDWRPGEATGLWFTRRLAAAIPARYRAVSINDVADRMSKEALTPSPGVHVIESEQIARPHPR